MRRAYKLRVAEVESYFIAPEIIERGDVEERRTKVSRIVAAQIIPRLAALKELVPDAARAAESPNAQDVSDRRIFFWARTLSPPPVSSQA